MVRAQVHSEKHTIQNSLATVLAGALSVIVLAKAVDTVGSTNSDVKIGASIKFLHVEEWIRTNDTSPGSFVWAIIKLPGGVSNPSVGDMANLNDYNNKNNVFHFKQGLINVNTADAIFVGTDLLIPKGKQRMSIGDQWVIVRFAQALDSNYCGKVIYKEYY